MPKLNGALPSLHHWSVSAKPFLPFAYPERYLRGWQVGVNKAEFGWLKSTNVATVKPSWQNITGTHVPESTRENWCAKRIRTPDPRITNSQLASVTHINQCVANAKRGLSLLKAANICSWWYKSGYSWTSTDFFTPPISALA